ncbi:MAG: head-tail adaptor protein [Acidaminococcales bacterium]|jgi:head-tail adaptor|nr:head-tail adaptor protein [Acidaminococcales bacterium]
MRLDKRLSILKPVYTDNGSGGQDVEYIEDGTLLANVKELEPTSASVRGKEVKIAKYEAVARKQEMRADWRLVYETHVLEVEYIGNIGGDPPFYLKISCREARNA